jgi:hypothetical protein
MYVVLAAHVLQDFFYNSMLNHPTCLQALDDMEDLDTGEVTTGDWRQRATLDALQRHGARYVSGSKMLLLTVQELFHK